MTALAAPVAGPSEASGRDFADCGSLAARSIVARLGVDVHVPSPDGATADQIAAAVNLLGPGLHARVLWGDGAAMVAQCLNAGHYAVLGVNCKSDATYVVPYVTGIRHWVACYDTAGWEYNCWQATYQQINFSTCHNSGMGTVEIWRDQPQEDLEMLRVTIIGSPEVWLLDGGFYVHVMGPADDQSLQATGVKTWTIDAAQHAANQAAAKAASGSTAHAGTISGTLTIS